MELSDYLQSGETVLCETTVSLDKGLDAHSKGDLACTDSRMLYSDRKGVTDIRLDGITEIVTSPPTYLNKYAGWALIALFAALVAPQIMTRIPEVAEFATPAGGLLVALAIVEAALAIYYAKWTVTIKTAQSEYQFISNDSSLQNIPHAVRGAE